MSESDIRRAYLEGMKLKNQGLSPDIIYARLENQGFDEGLAREVAFNVNQQIQKEESEEFKSYAFAKLGVGIAFTIFFYIIAPGLIILPISAIIIAIIAAARD